MRTSVALPSRTLLLTHTQEKSPPGTWDVPGGRFSRTSKLRYRTSTSAWRAGRTLAWTLIRQPRDNLHDWRQVTAGDLIIAVDIRVITERATNSEPRGLLPVGNVHDRGKIATGHLAVADHVKSRAQRQEFPRPNGERFNIKNRPPGLQFPGRRIEDRINFASSTMADNPECPEWPCSTRTDQLRSGS